MRSWSTHRVFRIVIPAIAGFVAGIAVPPLFATATPKATETWGEQYHQLPDAYRQMIRDSEQAFLERDAVAAGNSLTDDFSWYRVTDTGPVEMVHGRDATVERLKQFFASPAWANADSEVHRLGVVGNILVQVEIDTLDMGKGPVRQTSLHVYEFRDGKRWREFVFYPK